MSCLTVTVTKDLHWIKCSEIIYSSFLQNLVKMYQYGKTMSHFASRLADKICAHLQCRLFSLVIFLTL